MPAPNGNYELVKEWIRKNGKMPDGKPMPKRKMARMIYKEHNLDFNSEETVRLAIQKVTGGEGMGLYWMTTSRKQRICLQTRTAFQIVTKSSGSRT